MLASFKIIVDPIGRATVVWTIDHHPSATLNEMARMMNEALSEHARILNFIGTVPRRPPSPSA